jgi:methionyl-tRNA formyltransferase
MWMTEGLDEGPVFLRRATPIAPDEDAGTLGERLAPLGADLLAESLDAIARGAIAREEQDHARATHAPKLRTEDARLPLAAGAADLVRRVRAYTPAPGAWLELDAGRLTVLRASADAAGAGPEGAAPRGLDPLPSPPGVVVGNERARGLGIACGEGTLWLSRVRPAGRKEMSGADYANGARLRPGARIAARAPA